MDAPVNKTLISSSFKRLAILSLIFLASSIQAQPSSLETLQARISTLETQINNPPSPESAFWRSNQNIMISGLMEVEAAYIQDHNGTAHDSSDVRLATFELAMQATPNQYTQANITLLHEEGTPLDVDTANITINSPQNLNITLGKLYIPFGTFETHQVNDTLALEIAETQDTAINMGFSLNHLSAEAYVFANQEGKLNQSGLRLSFHNHSLNLTADYIFNILNSNTFIDLAEENDDIASLNNVHGTSLHLGTEVFGMALNAEHLFLGSIGNTQISATQIESAYSFRSVTIALTYQETNDAEILDLPKHRASLGIATDLPGKTQLALEVWNDQNYQHNNATNLVMQVAVEF